MEEEREEEEEERETCESLCSRLHPAPAWMDGWLFHLSLSLSLPGFAYAVHPSHYSSCLIAYSTLLCKSVHAWLSLCVVTSMEFILA